MNFTLIQIYRSEKQYNDKKTIRFTEKTVEQVLKHSYDFKKTLKKNRNTSFSFGRRSRNYITFWTKNSQRLEETSREDLHVHKTTKFIWHVKWIQKETFFTKNYSLNGFEHASRREKVTNTNKQTLLQKEAHEFFSFGKFFDLQTSKHMTLKTKTFSNFKLTSSDLQG